jgi:hypothetical protein
MNNTYDILVTPVETTILDAEQNIAYHELAGEESIMPLHERHKAFFRRLAELCRAMTNEPFKTKITVTDKDK